jgi:DNA repair protein RadC
MKTKKAAAYAELIQQAAAYVAEVRPVVRNAADIAAILAPLMATEPQEMFWCVHVNAKNMMIGAPVMVSKGLLNSAPIGIRETFRGAIMANACSIIVAHNHPSGDPTPSGEDIAITKKLIEAGQLLGVTVLDHLIIGQQRADAPGWVSLREKGLADFSS